MKKVLIIAILMFVFVSISVIVFTTQVVNTFTGFEDDGDDNDDDFTSNRQILFNFIDVLIIKMGLSGSHLCFPMIYGKCYSLLESFAPTYCSVE